MKPRIIWKRIIDLVMTVLLLCQMAYMLIGEAEHEWIGTAMFFLIILHHGLNWRWYQNLFRGRYTPLRVIQIFVNFLVLVSMIALMISGIIMSRYVFTFVPITGGMSFARTLHMLASYWGFLFMSIHLGLHWAMVMGMMRKIGKINKKSKLRTGLLRVIALLICIFGIMAFIKHNIASYLFMQSMFVFFDVEQPLIQFFAEYLAMMGLWVCVAYYVARLIQRRYV